MQDIAFPLYPAAHLEQPGFEQCRTKRLGNLLPDDQIHIARLILQGDERHAARAARPLARDHQAGRADHSSVRLLPQILRRQDGAPHQPVAQQGERMTAQRQTGTGIVGDDVLAFARSAQQRNALRCHTAR